MRHDASLLVLFRVVSRRLRNSSCVGHGARRDRRLEMQIVYDRCAVTAHAVHFLRSLLLERGHGILHRRPDQTGDAESLRACLELRNRRGVPAVCERCQLHAAGCAFSSCIPYARPLVRSTPISCRIAAGSFLAENFLLMKPEMVPATDFGVIGFPCVKFSKNHNGHDTAVDIDDPTTLALVHQLIAFLRAHAWKVVAIECVAGFFRSRAWEMIVREGVRGGHYELLGILHADSEAMGLPQIRDRRIAVLSTLPPARDLRSCFDELARMEARDRTTLADCILDAEQMRACYVSRATLRQVCARTSAKAFRKALGAAPNDARLCTRRHWD